LCITDCSNNLQYIQGIVVITEKEDEEEEEEGEEEEGKIISVMKGMCEMKRKLHSMKGIQFS
jgi:hypothetical protein